MTIVLYKLLGLLVFGLLMTVLLFNLIKKMGGNQSEKGGLVAIILNHGYRSTIMIALWVFALLAYQSLNLFDAQWLSQVKTFRAIIFLVALYYSIDLVLRYLHHFLKQQLTVKEFIVSGYKKFQGTARIVCFIIILFYAINHQHLYQQTLLSDTIWQWLSYFFNIVMVSVITLSLVSFADNLYTIFYQKDKKIALLIKAFSRPFIFLYLAFITQNSASFFVISSKVTLYLGNINFIFLVFSVAYFCYCIAELLTIFAFNYSKNSNKIINISLINLAAITVRLLIVVTAFLLIAQRLTGQRLEGIIAAMGIGGVAFALASQDLLKNLLAGITIMLDKPFTLGQMVSVLEYEGTIEQIGFRSTLLRTFDGQLVTMPNSKLSDSPIKNITERLYLRRRCNLSLSYQNSMDTVEQAIEIIKEILASQRPQLVADPTVVFNEITAISFNILIIYDYANYGSMQAFREFNQTIFLEILRQFESHKIVLAISPQNLYLNNI